MATILLYLEDTYLFEETANVVQSGGNENGKYIILDKTIFYPQGGGQPTDTGIIQNENAQFYVSMVRMDENGIVYHYGEYNMGRLMIWEEVSIEINKEKRVMNARNHSAWHLMDIAIKSIWLSWLIPTKWYHFIEGPYVEYKWSIDMAEQYIQKIEDEANRLILSELEVIVSTDTSCIAPSGKVPRYISFKWYAGCGCWGTHVRNSNEIWEIIIRKIKSKDDTVRVSYGVL